MYRAAQKYALERDKYHRLLGELQNLALNEADRRELAAAIKKMVRARFRGIANGLKVRTGHLYHTSSGCGSNLSSTKVEHEHAIPLNLIHNRILGIPTPHDEGGAIPTSHEDIENFLRHHMIVVRVTADEHKSLPAGNMPKDWKWAGYPLARYQLSRIDAYHHGDCPNCRVR